MMPRIKASWLSATLPQAVCAMLTDAGYQAWFVGGCVRNELLGQPISDIDITTDARPETTMELARNAGFKPVPTGIDHGTVTIVAQGEPFEITTFRRDIDTDGRRAVVTYANTIEEDAHRRDFTMNALYASPEGKVEDPVGGLPDLRARRVRFIDDPEERIREDYLRILRFFRFHAWYGDPAGELDIRAVAAISRNASGLELLSRERVGAEMKKLLSAPDPAPSVRAMARAAVLSHVLPGSDVARLERLIEVEAELGAAPDPIRRLAALGGDDAAKHLRLSRIEGRALETMNRYVALNKGIDEVSYRLGAEMARDVTMLRAASRGEHLPADLEAELARGSAARFPVTAHDLLPDYHGAALGKKLRELEDRWIASGFRLGRDALLGDKR